MNRQQKSGIVSRTDRRPARCRPQSSGIFDKRCLLNEEKSLLSNNGHVEDPRLQTSGMTPCLITETAHGFTSALVTPTLRAAHCAGYSAGKQQGFTLIELLVVVLIIGILAAVALPQYQKAVEKSRWTQWLTTMNGIEREAQLAFLARLFPSDGDNDYSICQTFESFAGGTWDNSHPEPLYTTKNFTFSLEECSSNYVYIDTRRNNDVDVEFYFYPNGTREIVVFAHNETPSYKAVCDMLTTAYGSEVDCRHL